MVTGRPRRPAPLAAAARPARAHRRHAARARAAGGGGDRRRRAHQPHAWARSGTAGRAGAGPGRTRPPGSVDARGGPVGDPAATGAPSGPRSSTARAIRRPRCCRRPTTSSSWASATPTASSSSRWWARRRCRSARKGKYRDTPAGRAAEARPLGRPGLEERGPGTTAVHGRHEARPGPLATPIVADLHLRLRLRAPRCAATWRATRSSSSTPATRTPPCASSRRRSPRVEDAEAALALSSGMAAMTTAVASLVRAGDEVLASASLYGGTVRLLTDLLPRFGVAARFVAARRPRARRPRGGRAQPRADRREPHQPRRSRWWTSRRSAPRRTRAAWR